MIVPAELPVRSLAFAADKLRDLDADVRRRNDDRPPSDQIPAFDRPVQLLRVVRESEAYRNPASVGDRAYIIPPELDAFARGFESHERLNVGFSEQGLLSSFHARERVNLVVIGFWQSRRLSENADGTEEVGPGYKAANS